MHFIHQNQPQSHRKITEKITEKQKEKCPQIAPPGRRAPLPPCTTVAPKADVAIRLHGQIGRCCRDAERAHRCNQPPHNLSETTPPLSFPGRSFFLALPSFQKEFAALTQLSADVVEDWHARESVDDLEGGAVVLQITSTSVKIDPSNTSHGLLADLEGQLGAKGGFMGLFGG